MVELLTFEVEFASKIWWSAKTWWWPESFNPDRFSGKCWNLRNPATWLRQSAFRDTSWDNYHIANSGLSIIIVSLIWIGDNYHIANSGLSIIIVSLIWIGYNYRIANSGLDIIIISLIWIGYNYHIADLDWI